MGGGGEPGAGVKVCSREQEGIPARKDRASAEAKFNQGGWRERQWAFMLQRNGANHTGPYRLW